MKILVTGASGFIGSFIVQEALRQGMETWAAVRPTSSKKYLQDERIHFINLNLSSKEELTNQLAGHEFDYVVHAAGATKCLHAHDFYRVNTEGTKNLVSALITLKMPIKRFVFVSSLSVFGAIREEQPYQEISEHDTPKPNTAYGKSKWEAEKYLESLGIQFPGVWSEGERLLLDGKKHQAACGFRRGLQATGHHFRLCRRCGTGCVPSPRPWNERQEILPQRWRGISIDHLQRPHPPRTWKSMDAAHQSPYLGTAHCDILRRIHRQTDWQNVGSQQ